ncbi:MAG TPA: alpha-ketoglutarate-dependent dioxygenase AlkB [Sphingomicrobium sp.]|jgi:alkylated DNA repair dioxygenase AlkB|nr:alpha-ketoglutarate-dependent dioxygenase AlkB [Sphingomicrobium sp.]
MMLFDAPLIPGLAYREELVEAAEEQLLIRRIEGVDLSPFKFQGWEGKRLTHTFGWRYDFDDRSFAPAEPLPDWLLPLRDKAARFGDIDPGDLVHALVTRYDPAAGIGWHRDRPQFAKVVGVTLAGSATLRFRQRAGSGFRRAGLELAPRSAYLLSGEVREQWEHGIAAHEELRYSITFRTLSDKGKAAANAPQA